MAYLPEKRGILITVGFGVLVSLARDEGTVEVTQRVIKIVKDPVPAVG